MSEPETKLELTPKPKLKLTLNGGSKYKVVLVCYVTGQILAMILVKILAKILAKIMAKILAHPVPSPPLEACEPC